MNRTVLSIIACLSAGSVIAQEQPAAGYRFTLEECLHHALVNNHGLQSVMLTEEAREDAHEQSRLERLPTLNASASETTSASKGNSPAWSGNYGLNASLTLYQGGTTRNTIEQNKLKREQSAYQRSRHEKELTIQVLQAFLAVLGNEELVKYQEAVVKASEEQAKQGKDQLLSGQILESDYLLLEAQLANDNHNIFNTRVSRDNSLLTLKNLLSIPLEEELRVVSPDTALLSRASILPPLEEVSRRGVSAWPGLKVSQYDIDIARVGVEISRAGYLPSISLSGSVGTGHANGYSRFGSQLSERLSGQAGLSLSIPVYDNRRARSRVTQSRIALQQAELEKKQAELEIQETLATVYREVTVALDKYRVARARHHAYATSLDVYRARFHAGAITTVELLQQQNNYISALNDYIQGKYEFILKRKILDVYTGIQVTM
jgi:outer membrane protein